MKVNNEVIKAFNFLEDIIECDLELYDDLQGCTSEGFYIAINMVYRNIYRVKELYENGEVVR